MSETASLLRERSQGLNQLDADLMLQAAEELSGMVKVNALCPGCESTTLFVGNGGYITCSLATCPNPLAAHRLLESHDLSGAIIAQESRLPATKMEALNERTRLQQRLALLDNIIADPNPPHLPSTVDGPVGEVGKPPAQYVGKGGLQPFEIIDAFGLDFYEGNALMYLLRWRWKNGIEDLRKAAHYIQEVIAHADGPEQAGD